MIEASLPGSRIRLTDVSPRDGLQSFPRMVSTGDKLKLVNSLIRAGFQSIEVTSFARPDVVPQLADAESLVKLLPRDNGVEYRALVPNVKGANRAIDSGIDTIVALTTASDTYTEKNQNATAKVVLSRAADVVRICRDEGIPCDVGIGMAFFDPYDGATPPSRVLHSIEVLIDAGAQAITLATSVGVADPWQVKQLCQLVKTDWPELDLGLHLHNTNGLALACAYAAAEVGVDRFEGAIAGIGGGIAMPHGMGAVGNVPMEDLVNLFNAIGCHVGLDTRRVVECAKEVTDLLGISPSSFAARGGTREAVLDAGMAAMKAKGDRPLREEG